MHDGPARLQRRAPLCEEGGIACVLRFEAGEEVCDGLDNDCDGAVMSDTGEGTLSRDCYGGADGTLGVGVYGRRASAAPTATGSASERCAPRQRFDGLDNDCDG